MTEQNFQNNRLSDAQAKSYERKIVFAAMLVFAVLIAGVFYLVSLFKGDPVTPLTPPAANLTAAATAATAAPDGLTLAHPRSAYDLPVTQHEKNPKLHFATGRVTAIVPRHDIMSNGSARQNLYARTEFTVPEHNRNCFFHQYMGLTATYKVNDMVPIQYDPNAKDFCGTARVVK